MTESKKEWHKPELIVLVRSKPEEAVLAACKWYTPFSGPGSYAGQCSPPECDRGCLDQQPS